MNTHYRQRGAKHIRRGPLSDFGRFSHSPVVDRAKWEKYDGQPCLNILSVQERLVPKTDQSLELVNSQLAAKSSPVGQSRG